MSIKTKNLKWTTTQEANGSSTAPSTAGRNALVHSVQPPVWWSPISIIWGGNPGEFHTHSAEEQLAVDRGHLLFVLWQVITNVYFNPRWLPFISRWPKYKHEKFISVRNIIWTSPSKSVKKPSRFKTWMEIVWQKLIQWESFGIWGVSSLANSIPWSSLGNNQCKK